MGLGRKRLGEILLEYGLINEEQLQEVLGAEGVDPLGQRIIDKGICSEEVVLKVLSVQLGLPSVRVADVAVPPDVLKKVPASLAEEFQVLPLGIIRDRGNDTLLLAMARPLDREALDAIRFVSQMRVLPLLAADGEMRNAVNRLYHDRASQDDLEMSLPTALLPDDPDVLAPEDEATLDDFVPPPELRISPEELLSELGIET